MNTVPVCMLGIFSALPVKSSLLVILCLAAIAYFFIVLPGKITWREKKKNLFMQLRHDNELLQVRVETQEQAFRDIAGEIHDNIGQQLSLAKFRVERFGENGGNIEEISELISGAISDLRDLSHSYSARLIEDRGLYGAIRKDIAHLNRTRRIVAEITEMEDPVQLTPYASTLLYRVFQEAVQNVLKHAQASNLRIFICAEDNELSIVVADNGKGIPLKSPEGLGFRNMRARMKLLGGSLSADSGGHGTSLMIKFPLHEKI